MKNLPTVNSRSVYAHTGTVVARRTDDLDEIESFDIDPVEKMRMKGEAHKDIAKYLSIQAGLYVAAIKKQEVDQEREINGLNTAFRNPEVKNFPNEPVSENASQKSIE